MLAGTRCTIGVDFGTESARTVLVDVQDGRELDERRLSAWHDSIFLQEVEPPLNPRRFNPHKRPQQGAALASHHHLAPADDGSD
jgi:hypothetical protein